MSEPLDVVGIGGLNRDFIVEWSHVETSDAGTVRSKLKDVERTGSNLENFADFLETTIAAADTVARAFGGSAFNTVRAMARLDLGLTLGYVSVLGSPPIASEVDLWPEVPSEIASGLIDGDGIIHSDIPTGACLSLVDDRGQRELRTYYNDELAAGLRAPNRRQQLVRYLARSRHIHVTSVLGDMGPSTVLQLLEEAKHQAPHAISISVDPGLPWAELGGSPLGPDILRIISLAQYVFVNDVELEHLGESKDLNKAARSLIRSTGSRAVVVVLKEWDRALMVRDDGETIDVAAQLGLPPPRIADATGGGDVFAAGFLASHLSRRGRELGDASLGLAAARLKLQAFGDAGYDRLRSAFTTNGEDHGAVFISHEKDDDVLARRFVNLLESIGVPIDRIFCLGVRGAEVPVGSTWLPEIAHRLLTASMVISLVTPRFLASDFCKYETGAAWILGKQHWSVLVGVEPDDLGPLRSPSQAARLARQEDIRDLCQEVTRVAGTMSAFSDSDWTRYWQNFSGGQ